MRRTAICGLALVMVVLFRPLSQAEQTRAIDVFIKDSSGRKIGFYRQSFELLIGASNYTARWQKLGSVPDEIDRVGAALRKSGFDVVKVMDPTGEELSEAFDDFTSVLQQQSRYVASVFHLLQTFPCTIG